MRKVSGKLLTSPARRKRVALVLDTSNSPGRRIMLGIARYLRERGRAWEIHLELGTAEEAPGLRKWRGDGIIARVRAPAVAKAIRPFDVPKVIDRPVPRVAGHRSATVVFPWSPGDGQAAFAHFAERGFRHFAFCTMRSGENWGREQRLASAVEQAGAGYHFHPSPDRGPSRRRPEVVEAAWVAALPKPVGIWAVNDMQAYRILEACRIAGAAVPDDVAVLGTDDDEPLCAMCSPHLSSINMHVSEIGFHAAEALDLLMSGTDPSAAAYFPPAEIIVRASTDTFAMADPAVKSVMSFIREYFAEPIGVKHLAAHGDISRRALERRFQQAVGRSPAGEIRRVRIEHAKRLLATTDLRMPEIARRCGFANAPRFAESFARAAGRTPSAFRRDAARAR